ncbi:AraC family transcriptional regulator [Spirochaetota bacterium]
MIYRLFHKKLFNEPIPLHQLAFYSCFYVTDGPGIITIGSKKYTCMNGDFLISFPFEEHGYDLIDGKPLGVFCFDLLPTRKDGSIYNDIDLLRGHTLIKLKDNKLPELENIGRSMNSTNLYERTRGEHCIISFLYELISMKNKIIVKDEETHAGISNFLIYIGKNYPGKKNVTAKDIAREFKVSYETVRREFMDKAHISPQQYIINYKINWACIQLVESDVPIKKLSEQLHYPDINSFGKAFKQHKCMSPSEYRKQHRKT